MPWVRLRTNSWRRDGGNAMIKMSRGHPLKARAQIDGGEIAAAPLEIHLVAALERKNLARLVGAGDLQSQSFQDLPDLLDLLGVALGELARPDPERVLHADANVATHRRGLGGDSHLVGAGAQHRPVIIAAEQAVGG